MEKRLYPACCTSAYCGSSDPEACKACPCFAELEAFKAWVEKHQAKRLDPIWSPSIYTATEEVGNGK